MFAIATFCGSRFGGWFNGKTEFATYPEAQIAIAAIERAERRCGFEGKLLRKVVPV